MTVISHQSNGSKCTRWDILVIQSLDTKTQIKIPENGPNCLVLPDKQQSQESIPTLYAQDKDNEHSTAYDESQ